MNTQTKLSTRKPVGESFSVPLGDLKKGQLEFANGVSNCQLTGDRSIQDLFHGQFSGEVPEVRTWKGRVLIQYQRSTVEWFLHELLGGRQEGNVRLNASIPWQIELRKGVSRLEADLRELQLDSLTITDGASDANIFLPRPTGTVRIQLGSGVSNLRIFRPQGVSASLKIGGGISELTFDDEYYGSLGGGIRLATSAYKAETDRYEITIGGGVSNLMVHTQL